MSALVRVMLALLTFSVPIPGKIVLLLSSVIPWFTVRVFPVAMFRVPLSVVKVLFALLMVVS